VKTPALIPFSRDSYDHAQRKATTARRFLFRHHSGFPPAAAAQLRRPARGAPPETSILDALGKWSGAGRGCSGPVPRARCCTGRAAYARVPEAHPGERLTRRVHGSAVPGQLNLFDNFLGKKSISTG